MNKQIKEPDRYKDYIAENMTYLSHGIGLTVGQLAITLSLDAGNLTPAILDGQPNEVFRDIVIVCNLFDVPLREMVLTDLQAVGYIDKEYFEQLHAELPYIKRFKVGKRVEISLSTNCDFDTCSSHLDMVKKQLKLFHMAFNVVLQNENFLSNR